MLDLDDVRWELGQFGKLNVRHGGRSPRPGRSLRVMPACRSRISSPPACSMIGSRSRRGRCPPLPAAPGRPVVWPGSGSSHGPEW